MGARAENACRHPALLPLPLPPTRRSEDVFVFTGYLAKSIQRSPAGGVAYELTDVSSVPVFRTIYAYCSVTTRFICLYM